MDKIDRYLERFESTMNKLTECLDNEYLEEASTMSKRAQELLENIANVLTGADDIIAKSQATKDKVYKEIKRRINDFTDHSTHTSNKDPYPEHVEKITRVLNALKRDFGQR